MSRESTPGDAHAIGDGAPLPGEPDDASFFRGVVEAASDPLLVIDTDREIVYANAAVERVFGYAPDELRGEPVGALIPEYARDGADETPAGDGHSGRTITGRRRDGREIELQVSFRDLDRGGGDDRLVVTLRDVTRRDERLREIERYETIVNAARDAVYQLDLQGRFVAVNDVAVEVSGYSRDELIGAHVSTVLDEGDIERTEAAIRRLLESEDDVVDVRLEVRTADGRTIPVESRIALIERDGRIRGTVGVARDVSGRERRERQLRRQRDELERLNHVNAIIRGIDRSVVGATTREEVETAVVDRLAAAEPYAGAVIGEYDSSFERFDVRSRAGFGEPTEGEFDALVSADERADRPAVRATEERSVEVIQDVRAAGDGPPWDGEYESVAFVPITSEEGIYGLLCVFGRRAHAFDERERDVLGELGRTIGNAIAAAETRRLLYAERVTELELRSTDPDVAFVDLSEAAGCRFALDRVLPAGDGVFLFYMTTTGASPERIRECAADHPKIETARVITRRDESCVFEFAVRGATLTALITRRGAKTRSGVVDRGTARATVEMPRDGDVRGLVEALRSRYPETELVAKREVERSRRTDRDFHRALAADMTDRQRTALEAAYYAGYFEWPTRESTATELAEILDVAPQTLHQHLRVAQDKLLTAYFEGEGGSDGGRSDDT